MSKIKHGNLLNGYNAWEVVRRTELLSKAYKDKNNPNAQNPDGAISLLDVQDALAQIQRRGGNNNPTLKAVLLNIIAHPELITAATAKNQAWATGAQLEAASNGLAFWGYKA